MSYFSAALDRIMGERQLTQTELSKRAQVHQGMLSRYINAESRPDSDGLERLCTALGDDATVLLVAFLRDEIPDRLRGLVQISTTEGQPATDEPQQQPAAYSRLGKREREIIDELIEGFEKSPALVAVIESTLSLIRER